MNFGLGTLGIQPLVGVPAEGWPQGPANERADVALAETERPPRAEQLHDRESALVGQLVERGWLHGEDSCGLLRVEEPITRGVAPTAHPASPSLRRTAED